MKFGPLPMYVLAPMKTEPMEMASSSAAPRSLSSNSPRFSELVPTVPLAAEAKVR